MELDGKVAVVTGAASGIGRALSERCLAEGMSVVLADIEGDKVRSVAAALASAGGAVHAVEMDVADSDQVEALRDEAVATFGTVHLLANNAGVGSPRPNVSTSPALWRWITGVNLLGVAYGVSAFAPLMVDQGEGHIVNTASEAGLTPSPILGAYHATKYAVVGLSESLALELNGTGVGVSCLCPELVDTLVFESTRNAPPELGLGDPPPVDIHQVEQWMQTVAMDPADVAAQVVYAVKAGRFWVLTHQSTLDRVKRRNADLEAGRVPKGVR
ncbi:MAG TPA: SDR family NAD(P)-dependent oxidoreductase [Acidimicrobiales bacterium]|nr:SDR family NAD(P)-dependent oxidoreductase [Acidimicrobiales bacterium]